MSHPQVAVCNLASIALPSFVDESKVLFDHQKLYEISYTVTKNLNRVIEHNFYPVEEARVSNMKHRPIGIGVQVRDHRREIAEIALDHRRGIV